jgi:hypothetical protein
VPAGRCGEYKSTRTDPTLSKVTVQPVTFLKLYVASLSKVTGRYIFADDTLLTYRSPILGLIKSKKNKTEQIVFTSNDIHYTRSTILVSTNKYLASIAMVLLLSAADILGLGLHFAGFEVHRYQRTCLATNLQRFRGHFGVSPEALSAIFTDLQTTNIVEAHIDNPNPSHFLTAINWLRAYKIEEQLAGGSKMTEKTAQKWIWKYTEAFQALKAAKVSSNTAMINNYMYYKTMSNIFSFVTIDCLELR